MGNLTKFDFYKLCVEEAGKISERRMKNNQYFTLIHAALLSFISTLFTSSNEIKALVAISFLSFVGAILCYHWKCSIIAYKQLNTAKFDIICKMEKEQGFCPVFSDEWLLLKKTEGYRPLSEHENSAAAIFMWAYIMSFLVHAIMIVCYILDICS